MNEHESAAMWKLYTRTNEAVAVQSTYATLRKCLPDGQSAQPRVYLGTVQYVDYDTETIPEGNAFWPLVHKRRGFAHEHELRAVTADMELAASGKQAPSGITIPVEVDRLVHRVVIAPTAPTWFPDLVARIVERFGLKKELVFPSVLDALPVF